MKANPFLAKNFLGLANLPIFTKIHMRVQFLMPYHLLVLLSKEFFTCTFETPPFRKNHEIFQLYL